MTWHNLMEKTEYIGGDGFLPAPHKGTHVRLGLGGGGSLLSWTQCAAQEVRHLCEEERGLSSHQTWGVTQENTLQNNTELCPSVMPASIVKPANSGEITQDGTCGTALSLAQ